MASSELTSQIPALVCCYFLPTARCPAQMTPSHPLPIFGFRSCKSGGCRGRKEAEEISHKSPVCRCMHKAGSLQARAMAVCQSAEISGSREPRGQGRGVCFPFRNRKNKAPKNKNQKKPHAKPPFHSLWQAAISAETAGRKRGGGRGEKKAPTYNWLCSQACSECTNSRAPLCWQHPHLRCWPRNSPRAPGSKAQKATELLNEYS